MSPDAELQRLCGELIGWGTRRIHVVAWRDLDDRDAGGSEVHADEFMQRWANAGLDVLHRTSAAVDLPATDRRNGYRVIRRGSRYSVFPRTVMSELFGRMGRSDAFVEIWNGVPWFSPLWYRGPHVTMLHHVHGPMWDQIFPAPFSAMGRMLETRIAPPLYRRTLTVTPSEAARDELLELGFRPELVWAFPNGVDSRFSPGKDKSAAPSIIAVGRLAPVKRFDMLIDAAVEAKRRVPNLSVTIVGEGPMRSELEARIAHHDANGWIAMPGRISNDDLVERYRQAWLVASASIAEGWGLSLTEGAACGTPAVATDIRGHRSSVRDGSSGVLVEVDRLGATLADVLTDHQRLGELRRGALDWAGELSWDTSALGITKALHHEVDNRRGKLTRYARRGGIADL